METKTNPKMGRPRKYEGKYKGTMNMFSLQLPDEMKKQLDKASKDLSKESGTIVTKSDVARIAIETWLDERN